ncbi:MAG: TRAM domain-containing protein [Planctomycetales bacterium]|nr:TRAM domain-containing protein [Planctomycetales bacterium]
MAIWILRFFFLAVAIGVGASLVTAPEFSQAPWAVLPTVLLGAITVIVVDWLSPRKRIEVISSVYVGVVVGLFLTYLLGLALTPWIDSLSADGGQASGTAIQLLVSVTICYFCISVLMQTKDDFRFIIPYVEFSREVKGGRPFVLDTSVVIDGRIVDVVDTGILDNQLVMPRFVLAELQAIADSGDKMRRARGRRGLDVLNKLRAKTNVDFVVYERELPEMQGQPVDMKIVLLAAHLDGKVVTGDFNLNKVARIHNVPVINLNEIANALKPVFLPGETIRVKVVKPGEEAQQGVGYLEDGTMVVVEGGREQIGKVVVVDVTKMLQTSAGRMVFGRFMSLG